MEYNIVLSCGIVLAGCLLPAIVGGMTRRGALKTGLAALVMFGALAVLAVNDASGRALLQQLQQAVADVAARDTLFSS